MEAADGGRTLSSPLQGSGGLLGGPRKYLLQGPLEGVPQCHPHDPAGRHGDHSGALAHAAALAPTPRDLPVPGGEGSAWEKVGTVPGQRATPATGTPRGQLHRWGFGFTRLGHPTLEGPLGGPQEEGGVGGRLRPVAAGPVFQNKHQTRVLTKDFCAQQSSRVTLEVKPPKHSSSPSFLSFMASVCNVLSQPVWAGLWGVHGSVPG